MKIEIPDSLRVDIVAAITKTTASADAVRNTQLRIDAIESEHNKSNSKISAIVAVEIPNEKQVAELVVAERRRDLFGQRLAELGNEIETQKNILFRNLFDANEVFRRGAGKSLTDETKRQVIESLPPNVKSNSRISVAIWSGSPEHGALASFLNPPLHSPKDGSETLLDAAERILRLLGDLLAGNDISAVPSSPVAAA